LNSESTQLKYTEFMNRLVLQLLHAIPPNSLEMTNSLKLRAFEQVIQI